MKYVGYAVLSVIVIAYAAIVRGWVFSKLWLWFAVTIFGLPSIATLEAVGLMVMVRYLALSREDVMKKDDSLKDHWGYLGKLLEIVAFTTVSSLCVLAVGAIVNLWVG